MLASMCGNGSKRKEKKRKEKKRKEGELKDNGYRTCLL
jgi:hypothetical protein